jgi:hypothetical protein
VACHRADVVDSVPLSADLRQYRNVAVFVIAPALEADDAAEFEEELRERLADEELWRDIRPPGETAELVLRLTLVGQTEDDELTFSVELFDDRRRMLVGRFEVTADGASSGGIGTGVSVNFSSDLTRALEKAAKAIVAHLHDLYGN